MTSVVGICNLALSHIGNRARVMSLDPVDQTVEAEHCATFYPIARDMVLEAHPWGMALHWIDLVQLSVTPPDTWRFVYQRPNDCRTALTVLFPGSPSDDEGQEFIEAAVANDVRVILTNVENASLRYIKQVEDTAKYSALMVMAISRLLASFLAGPILKGTEGVKMSVAQMTLYQGQDGRGGALALAKSADANARLKNTYKNFVPASIKARL